MADAVPMNPEFAGLLQVGALSDLRHDTNVARQGVMNNQQILANCILAWAYCLVSMDVTESYAIQGLAASQAPRDAMGLRTAVHVPMSDAANKP
jgi:hypothetical protein